MSIIKTIAAVGFALCAVSYAQAREVHIGSWDIETIQDQIKNRTWVLAGIRTRDAQFVISCESGKPYMRLSFGRERFNSDDVFSFAIRIDDNAPTQGLFGVLSHRTLVTPLSRTTYK